MSQSISLQTLGVHLLRDCEKLRACSALSTRTATINVKEIIITLPVAAADKPLPQIIAIGEREPLLFSEALKQLEHIKDRAIISAGELQKIPAESVSQLKLRLRF